MNPLHGGLTTWIVVIAIGLCMLVYFWGLDRKYIAVVLVMAVVAGVAVAFALRKP